MQAYFRIILSGYVVIYDSIVHNEQPANKSIFSGVLRVIITVLTRMERLWYRDRSLRCVIFSQFVKVQRFMAVFFIGRSLIMALPISSHRFSIILRSGECAGHCITFIPWLSIHLCFSWAVWTGRYPNWIWRDVHDSQTYSKRNQADNHPKPPCTSCHPSCHQPLQFDQRCVCWCTPHTVTFVVLCDLKWKASGL